MISSDRHSSRTNVLPRVTFAFEKLTPLQACARFSRGVGRSVRYIHGPIKISVSIPSGYREHLEILVRIEDGDIIRASRYLAEHIDGARRVKVPSMSQ